MKTHRVTVRTRVDSVPSIDPFQYRDGTISPLTSPSPSIEIRSALDRAAGWFLQSGIQVSNGGVARYYHSDVHQNAAVSTEITGYAVSALVFAHARRGDPAPLEAAVRAADFLCDTAWSAEYDTFPFELPRPDGRMLSYFFDLGIIVRGLLRIYDVTRTPKYLDRAKDGARAMARDFPHEGAFHPILELPSKAALPYEPQWSRSPGCYQLKSALAWYELFRVTGEESYLSLYERAVESAMSSEERFLPDPVAFEKTMDRLHAFSYYLEALLPLADHADCATALERGIQRVSGYLRQIRPAFARSDVYAQLLRVRLYAEVLAGIRLQTAEASEEAAAIEAFQVKSADVRVNGGFYFGERNGALTPYVNPVSAAFCSQALEFWRDREAGTFAANPALVI